MVSDAKLYAGRRDQDSQRHQRDLEEWINDDAGDHVYSLVNICAELNLDLDWMRRRLNDLIRGRRVPTGRTP